jgi:general stress protein 26
MNTREKVTDMLDDFATAMMVTHAGSGPLDCRPMHIASSDVRHGGPIWFLASSESRKVLEVSRDATTLLLFQEGDRYLAIWGTSRVSQDRARIEQLWREPFREWLPEGPTDADIRVIAVTPHSAEFWDDAGANKHRYLFETNSARAAGDADPVSEEQHGRTNL